jgi:hypothetical protein
VRDALKSKGLLGTKPWVPEKQVLLKRGTCGIAIGLQRMSDAANCKIARDG